MIRSLRRLRWLPAFLTLLSPAVGGELLPLLHPCPVESPWQAAEVAPAPATGHDHGHHAAPAAPDTAPHEHGGDGSCSCLGECQAPVLMAPPRAPEVATGVISLPTFAATAPEDAAPSDHLVLDRLPPTTAPPLA